MSNKNNVILDGDILIKETAKLFNIEVDESMTQRKCRVHKEPKITRTINGNFKLYKLIDYYEKVTKAINKYKYSANKDNYRSLRYNLIMLRNNIDKVIEGIDKFEQAKSKKKKAKEAKKKANETKKKTNKAKQDNAKKSSKK